MCGSDPKIKVGEETDKMMKALVANYPALAEVMNSQVMPTSLAELEATKAVYPQTQQLGIDTDLALAKGSGGNLLDEALKLDQKTNPEFYSSRASTSSALDKLYDSIDVSGELSGGERAEIERGNNRANNSNGVANGTPTSAIEGAMNFGNASTTKKLAQQGILTGAVNAGSNFLPNSKSGIDAFQVATGRSSSPTKESASTSAGLASGLSNSVSGITNSAIDANSNRTSGFEKIMGSMPDYS